MRKEVVKNTQVIIFGIVYFWVIFHRQEIGAAVDFSAFNLKSIFFVTVENGDLNRW